MFDWNESFSVKIAEIDEQHKKLFDIGENINELLRVHDGLDNFDENKNVVGQKNSREKVVRVQPRRCTKHICPTPQPAPFTDHRIPVTDYRKPP